MTLQYGLWDQIRTDQGKEWNLMLFVNEKLSHLRNDCSKPPHLQSSSKQVRLHYFIQRMWADPVSFVVVVLCSVLIVSHCLLLCVRILVQRRPIQDLNSN